jgi:HemY protein
MIADARKEAQAAQAAGLNQRRLYLLMAQIEGTAGDDAAATGAALRHAAEAEPDAVWRCTNCHTPSPEWHAACPACLTPGALSWGGRPASSAVPGHAGMIGGAFRRLLRS